MRIAASPMTNVALLYQTLQGEAGPEKEAGQPEKAQEGQAEESSPVVQLKKLREAAAQKEKESIQKMAEEIKEKRNPGQDAANAMAKAAGSSGGGKVSVSTPDDSVGQLASELANAHSKLDVSTVSGKAIRAMANLRMSLVFAEGKQKETIRRMITRMEKLQKRIRSKMKSLTKEEQMERQCAKAEKEQELQKARNLKNELRNRRSKRRRDEHNYATRELAEDRKQSLNEGIAAVSSSASVPSAAASAPVLAEAVPVEAAAAPAVDGAALDIHI